MKPPSIVRGTIKTRIVDALAEAAPDIMAASDLCRAVYGEDTPHKRLSIRVMISQMRPKLAEHGFAIHGRKELRMNAYRLVNTLLE